MTAENQPYQILLNEGAVEDLNRLQDAAAAAAKQYPDKTAAHNANRTLFKGTLKASRPRSATVPANRTTA